MKKLHSGEGLGEGQTHCSPGKKKDYELEIATDV